MKSNFTVFQEGEPSVKAYELARSVTVVVSFGGAEVTVHANKAQDIIDLGARIEREGRELAGKLECAPAQAFVA